MKLIHKSLVAAACAGAILFSGGASAAGTSSVTVTGTVVATCAFTTSGPFSIPFGTLNPATTTNVVMSTNLDYQCTNGTPASSIKVNGAASPTTVTITSGANNLPVGLTWTVPATPGSGIGPALPVISMPLTGTILASNLNTAMAGVYTGTFAVALLP